MKSLKHYISTGPTKSTPNVFVEDLCEDILSLAKRADFLSVPFGLIDNIEIKYLEVSFRHFFVSFVDHRKPFSMSFVDIENIITEKYDSTYHD